MVNLWKQPMSNYQPDNWIILKISENETFYKVLCGWSGGYLHGDSWRMNSGIEKITEDDEYYNFIGASGSAYKCHKDSELIRMNIAGVLHSLTKKYPDSVKEIPIQELIDIIGISDA